MFQPQIEKEVFLMFQNIGPKLKNVAKILCWIGIVISVCIAIYFIVAGVQLNDDYYTRGSGNSLITTGILYLILGPLFSWLGSISMYGIGEAVENSKYVREKLDAASTEQTSSDTNTARKPGLSNAEALKQLKEEGIITQEEYNSKVKKAYFSK